MTPPTEDRPRRIEDEPGAGSAVRAVQEALRRQDRDLRELGSRLADLEERLGGLEERAVKDRARTAEGPRPAVETGSPAGRRRVERLVHHLQDAIEHLAADGAELREQLAAVVTLLEERRDPGALPGGVSDAGVDRKGLVQRIARRAARRAKRLIRPAYRTTRRLAGRLRRAVLRRLPSAWSPDRGAGDEVRLSLGRRRPVRHPALSVVVPVDGLEPEELRELTAGLRRQTVTSVEWLLWSAARGTVEVCDETWATISTLRATDVTGLRETLRGVLATTATRGSGALPASWLETAVWSAIAMDLLVIRLTFEDSDGRRILHPDPSMDPGVLPADLLVTRRDLWTPEGLDVRAFLTVARRGRRVLGRVVRQLGELDPRPLDRSPLLPRDARHAVRLSDGYLVPARQPESLFRHEVFPLDGILPEDPIEDPRRTVLVLVPFLAIGGAEKLTYDLMRQLAERFRFVVVTLAPHDAVLGARLDEFRRLTPHVYTLGESLAHLLLSSAVSHLIGKYRVETVFNANGTTWFYEALPALRERFPDLTIVNQLFDHREGWIEYYDPRVVEDCDVHLATNDAIEATLIREHRVPAAKIRKIPHGIDLEDFRPGDYSAERRAALRRELGVPREALLVTMAVRMHPQKRPEDFVLLAHSMEEHDGLFFLLVGGGPLDGTVDDLIDYYAPSNLRRLGFYSPIADLLAVTDVACMMSEYEALPLYVLSALAMETPVVATAVGAIDSVLHRGPCGIVVPKIGDLEAFRDAIASLEDPARRRELGSAGRELVEETFAIQRAAEAYGQVFEEPVARPESRKGGG